MISEEQRVYELGQGNMTIAEYEKKFTELAKCASVFLLEETDKCQHFKDGLRTEIQSPMTANTNWSDFLRWIRLPCELRGVWGTKRKSLRKKRSSSMLSKEVEMISVEGSRKRAKSNFSD